MVKAKCEILAVSNRGQITLPSVVRVEFNALLVFYNCNDA